MADRRRRRRRLRWPPPLRLADRESRGRERGNFGVTAITGGEAGELLLEEHESELK